MRTRHAPAQRRPFGVWAATAAGCVVAALAWHIGPAQAETTVVSSPVAPRAVQARVTSAVTLSSASSVASRTAASAGPTAGAASATVQIHYAAPIRTATGDIDLVRTINAIKARGSRVYSYLIYPKAGYNSARDWAALPAFLAKARARGVFVQVTLTPPSSTSTIGNPCSADRLLPYKGRYDQWMTAIGRLARTHPNLTGVVMDDYSYGSSNRDNIVCPSFNAGTIGRWNAILTRYARRPLKVMPVLYLRDLVGKHPIYPYFAKDTPAVVWPFTQIGSGLMAQQYVLIKKANPKLVVHVMVYAAPFKGFPPTPRSIRDEISTARRLRAPAVVVYQQPLH